MDAISLLLSQHREVDELFAKLEAAPSLNRKYHLFEELADKLTIHAAIEEHHFYPAVPTSRIEKILLKSLEEHLSIKRELADLIDMEANEARFSAAIKVLKEQVEHHAEEVESNLFPKVRKLMDKDQLEAIGQAMSAEQAARQKLGNQRENVRFETETSVAI